MNHYFENKDIANLMNKYYICVKVDREELPTVDQIYQAYVENFSEGGGWPLTCFLTPHLKPFFGGTYFSPEPKNGMPGFATILKNIASNWRTNHQSILVNAIDDFTQLKETIKLADGDMGNIPINAFSHLHLAEKTFSLFKSAFDWQYGGISEDCNRSKFPRVSVFRFFMWFHTVTCVPQDVIDDVQRLGPSQMEISKMVRLAEGFGIDTTSIPRKYMHGILVDKLRMRRVQACEAMEIVEATAGKMAAGGIHDWVGGGFHRFEKMLYDQGQLLSLYSDLFAITKKPLYEQVATGIYKYLCRDMKHPEGAFYGGQDADCEVIAGSGHKEEGSVYLWTESEIDQVLGADSAIFKSHYNIKKEGNVNSIDDESGELQGKNVIYEVQTLAETAVQYKLREDDLSKKLEKCRETLLEVRKQRPQPHREEKIVTSWNGLTISGLAKAGRVFQNEDMVLSACSAATFIRKYMYNERTATLIRQFDSSAVGYADDYAFLIDGLLELYSATWDDSWIEWAVNLQMTMNRLFWDSNSGGYFSGGNETGVLIRMKEDSDKSEPSAGSVAVYNLLRLDALMGSTLPGDTARRTSLTKSLGSVASLSDKQTRNLTFKERAHRTLMAHYVGLSQLPRSLPYMSPSKERLPDGDRKKPELNLGTPINMSAAIVDLPANTDFPLENIPFGIISTAADATPRPATAIGDHVVDLRALAKKGLFTGPLLKDVAVRVFSEPSLNAFMRLGRPSWREARATLQTLLSAATASALRDDKDFRATALLHRSTVKNHLPAQIGDYTDFYSSREHAFNVGVMFRGKDNALQPNWVHLPVGYHGRASSVVVSGTPIRRPNGLIQDFATKEVLFSQCKKFDYELETAFIIGTGNDLGEPIKIEDAEEHMFGMVLMNDWSARDIQAFEYVPLGPFLGKNFGTTISPWIVTMDALEPFRVAQPVQTPTPASYLKSGPKDAYDLQLHATLKPAGSSQDYTISKTNLKYMYWSMKQQLAHHAVNGCNLNAGDLLGSGTISGPDNTSLGSLLEASLNGKQDVVLSADGSVKRTFIEDGDSLTITGTCETEVNGKKIHIGFGACEGTVLPAAKF
ncbi:hypothetical protein HDU79_003132 [Rhizoclosmatium sp. JEL0117]|nr:hypothetical protein HDU79_003132 [Rhizoclosmatium sp. JEL0117]